MAVGRGHTAFNRGAGRLAGMRPARAAGDYPTDALADYVYGCMKANGETRDALERCSCSIDVIASIMSYDDYVDGRDVSPDGVRPPARPPACFAKALRPRRRRPN